jgi:hypothetical protein
LPAPRILVIDDDSLRSNVIELFYAGSSSRSRACAGQFATLDAVVDFYDAGGGTPAPGTTKDPRLAPLGSSAQEKSDRVAFLRSLSGEPIPERLLCDDGN